ncbi:MAG: hypothetical protein FD119_1907 [Stygiobacter sp.]|nr:MAG: hypothetical protein FD119_1907 [Stygiobacter sp.]
MKTYWLAALAAFGTLAAGGAAAGEDKWGAHLDLEGKAGTKRNLGEADLFLPVAQDDRTLLFADLRTRLDDEGSREGNFGLGIRRMLESGWNLGGYGFLDRRRSTYSNYFNQMTVGAEALSLDWDFRVNGYVPVGRTSYQEDSLSTAEISGAGVIFRGGEERSLGGFDAEIGWRIPIFADDADRQVRVYAGGYRFADEGIPMVAGPRGRAEMVFDEVPGLWEGSRLALGAELQNDDPRGTQGFLSARLRIPLQAGAKPSRLTPMERRMADPIVRDIDVVAQAGAFGAAETATTTGGNAISVVSSATTTGADLPAAITAAGANSTVILSGSFSPTATTTLQTGQTVMGGGSLTVRSPSGRTATLTLSSATVSTTIAAAGAATTTPGFMMATDSTLTGLTISFSRSAGNGAYGVYATNISGATISNNTITGTETGANTGAGVVIGDGSSNITVSNNTITGTTGAGANAFALGVVNAGGGAAATVTGNTLSASGGSTNNYFLFSNNGTFNTGSTGNVKGSGTCSSAGTTGNASFTDGSTCP